MAGFLGSGTLYMDRLTDAGVSSGGYVQVGNATQFAITEESELKERKSTGKTTYGQVVDSVALKSPAGIGLTIDDLDYANLAIALLGSSAALTVTGSTVTDEAVTAKLDLWVEMDQKRVSSVVVQDVTDTTTYVVGTDYEINADLGMIKALSTGSISADDVLHVDYSYASINAQRISGSTTPVVKVKLMLDGKNQVNGKNVTVVVDEAVLTPEGEIDFMGEDFATVALTGTLNTLTGKTAPYTVDMDQ